MWIFQKVQDRAERLPAEISQLMGNSMEISSKANLLNKLHSNVLTPDKIPNFFLPPRLTRQSFESVENIVTHYLGETGDNFGQNSLTKANRTEVIKYNCRTKTKNKDIMVQPHLKKSIPFSVGNYESGYSESPNTRRKESLFHSTFSSYKLERITTRDTPKLPSITVLKVGSLESDTSLSSVSSPYSLPRPVTSKHDVKFLSCSASNDCRHEEVPQSSRIPSGCHPKAKSANRITSSMLALPLQFPLDGLHCHKQIQSEHILLLPHRGCIRLSASSVTQDQTTVRIHVISVEDMREPDDNRPLHCGVNLSLSPGKLQRQHSAIIRNCHKPVFNEDFFFTKPEGQEQELQDYCLRVKVLEKSSGLGRATMLGVVVKPLSELLAH